MPLIRYFLYTGGVLLALLLLVGGYTGEPAREVAQGGLEPAVARIQSTQKWPEKIVFDTTAPRVSAPDVAAAALAAAAPAEPQRATREAFAMAAPAPTAAMPAKPAASNRRVAERHHRHPPQRFAARSQMRAQMMFFPMAPMAMGW
jgi:hypothetical protein